MTIDSRNKVADVFKLKQFVNHQFDAIENTETKGTLEKPRN